MEDKTVLKKKNMFSKHVIKVVMVILIFVSVPLIIDYLIIGNNFPSNIENSDWVSFFGGYIGAFATLIGIWWTIKFTREQAIEDRKFEREQAREQALEERANQCEPKLLLETSSNALHINRDINIALKLHYDEINENNKNINIYLTIKNIGLGQALDISVKNIRYKNVNLTPSCNFTGLEVGNDIIIRLSINMFIDRIVDNKPIEIWDGPFESREETTHSISGYLEFDIEYSDLFGHSYYYRINARTLINLLCWYIEEKGQWMLSQTQVYFPQISNRKKIYLDENDSN